MKGFFTFFGGGNAFLSATGTDFFFFCTEEQFGCIEMTVRFIISTLRLLINRVIYLKRGNYKKYNFPFLIC